MNDKEAVDEVLRSLDRLLAILDAVEGGENDHLLGYATDGMISARGYLETFRRRLDDPESG